MRIVILGGGFGGLNSALWLSDHLQESEHEIILVADQPNFLFRPSLIWVPFGARKIEDISFSLETTLNKAGVQFILNKVVQVLPKEKKVVLEDETAINYDFLVIATSGFPDYASIEGLKDNTASIYHAGDALKTKEGVKTLKSGEPIVVGVAEGNPCPCNAYEFLFELDAHLKHHKIESPITFFTYEEELFDLSANKASHRLEKHMQEKNISFYCNVKLDKVDKENVYLSNGEILPYSFSLILPRYKGADFIFLSNDIDHENGLIHVNHHLQTIKWDNIYAVGDTILIKDMPMLKNGRGAELQGHIAAKNIYSQLNGEPPKKEFQDSLLGLLELGTDGGMFMVKYPTSKLASSFFEWAADGAIPHLMKIAYEKYYMWKLS